MSKRICYENKMLHFRACLCFSQAQLDNVLKHYEVTDKVTWKPVGLGCTYSVLCPSKIRIQVICMNKKGLDSKSLLTTLVHECTHVWQHHKQFIGEESDCWEIEAYFISAVFDYFLPYVVNLTAKEKVTSND